MDYRDDLDPRCIMCGYHPRVPMTKVHGMIELDRLRELVRPSIDFTVKGLDKPTPQATMATYIGAHIESRPNCPKGIDMRGGAHKEG